MSTPSSQTGRRGGVRSRVFVWLLLACLLIQGTAVQAHLHFASLATSIASGDGTVTAAKPNLGDRAADCALCQEAAIAGAYLLPVAIALPFAPGPAPALRAAPVRSFALPAPDHGWLSRAPPQ